MWVTQLLPLLLLCKDTGCGKTLLTTQRSKLGISALIPQATIITSNPINLSVVLLEGVLNSFFFLSFFKLRYDSYHIKFTIWNDILQWFLVDSLFVQPSPLSNSRTVPSLQRETPYLSAVSPNSPSPVPGYHSLVFCHLMDSPILDITYLQNLRWPSIIDFFT